MMTSLFDKQHLLVHLFCSFIRLFFVAKLTNNYWSEAPIELVFYLALIYMTIISNNGW